MRVLFSVRSHGRLLIDIRMYVLRLLGRCMEHRLLLLPAHAVVGLGEVTHVALAFGW